MHRVATALAWAGGILLLVLAALTMSNGLY